MHKDSEKYGIDATSSRSPRSSSAIRTRSTAGFNATPSTKIERPALERQDQTDREQLPAACTSCGSSLNLGGHDIAHALPALHQVSARRARRRLPDQPQAAGLGLLRSRRAARAQPARSPSSTATVTLAVAAIPGGMSARECPRLPQSPLTGTDGPNFGFARGRPRLAGDTRPETPQLRRALERAEANPRAIPRDTEVYRLARRASGPSRLSWSSTAMR